MPGDSLCHGQRKYRKARYRGERDKYDRGDKTRDHQGCYPTSERKEKQRWRAKEMGWAIRHTHRSRLDSRAP